MLYLAIFPSLPWRLLTSISWCKSSREVCDHRPPTHSVKIMLQYSQTHKIHRQGMSSVFRAQEQQSKYIKKFTGSISIRSTKMRK